MEGGYLFKDKKTGEVLTGAQTQTDEKLKEQTGIFVEKRNEFLKRNKELQESLWRGRDSESMTAVKNTYMRLSNLMAEEIPEDKDAFDARKADIEECYARLIRYCREYIDGHKNPFTRGGKRRKAMVATILSNATVEEYTLSSSIDNLGKIRQEGMIWGNLFGEMQENVQLSLGVYDVLDDKFPEDQEVPAGAKTMELAKVLSASKMLDESEEAEKGTMVSGMAISWVKDNMSKELKKEYQQIRKFVTKIIVNDYRRALAYGDADPKFYEFANRKDPNLKKQYTLLMIIRSENYGYYKALKEMAGYFGEDPLKCGVEGEEVFDGLKEDTAYFSVLKPEKVRESLELTKYYRRVRARSLLDGYMKTEKLDSLLGANLKIRQNNVAPFKLDKQPTADTAGKTDLDGEFTLEEFGRKQGNFMADLRADVVEKEPGEDTVAKWSGVGERLMQKYGENVFDSNLQNADGTKRIQGLNTSRVFNLLERSLGGSMAPNDIEALYDKLLSRSFVGTGEGQISVAEADRLFDRGMEQLFDIYLEFLRRMEVTYGRLLVQMHPEDIARQYGDEFYFHMNAIQDMEQLKLYYIKHYNKDKQELREFVFLTDYFFDIYNRSVDYLSHNTQTTPEETWQYLEGQTEVRNLLNVENFNYLKGPQMSPAQKRKYNEDMKKRFKEKGGNWELRLFSEFRGVKNN